MAAEPGAISASRHEFARLLRERGIADSDVESAVMILGELLANACEHGRLPVDVLLSSRGSILELRVDDSGIGVRRPAKRDPNSLRGRGFEIIERLGGRIALQGRPHSSVRVVLPFSLAG
jgi:anti-sigma regulatory factor (Ser/Thr protein kinase)